VPNPPPKKLVSIKTFKVSNISSPPAKPNENFPLTTYWTPSRRKLEIGMITPPVGLNLFVTSGVAGMPMLSVVRAALPFLCVLFVFLILVTYVPWISTFLPNLVMGPEIILK